MLISVKVSGRAKKLNMKDKEKAQQKIYDEQPPILQVDTGT